LNPADFNEQLKYIKLPPQTSSVRSNANIDSVVVVEETFSINAKWMYVNDDKKLSIEQKSN
jgi:hypothetical protein